MNAFTFSHFALTLIYSASASASDEEKSRVNISLYRNTYLDY